MDSFDKEKVKMEIMRIVTDLQALLIYIDSGAPITSVDDPRVKDILKEKAERKKQKEPDAETYKIAKSPCKYCQGLVSWEGFVKGSGMHPKHVNEDGTLLGDGECPKYGGD